MKKTEIFCNTAVFGEKEITYKLYRINETVFDFEVTEKYGGIKMAKVFNELCGTQLKLIEFVTEIAETVTPMGTVGEIIEEMFY